MTMTQSAGQKKVLVLITKSNWGGAQRYVYDLVTTLDPIKYQPIVACGGNGELIEKLQTTGIRVTSIAALERDIGTLQELRAFLEILAIIRTEKPDVIHVNSSKAGLYGAFLGRILGVKRVIFTAHGWAFNEDRPLWQQLIFKSMHWLTVIFSHTTITVSHAVKEQLQWPFAQNKMITIPLGRAVPAFKTKDDARQLIEIHAVGTERGLVDFHADTWIGTIAELHPVKNLSVAIDAVAALTHVLPKLRYVIIGEGQERERLTTQIQQLGLEEHVFLVGAFPEAAKLIPAFDIFVLPSHSEASGYVLLEAGLAGVPVIASNVGGVPELIMDKQTGLLVPAGGVDALVAAVRECLEKTEDSTQRANLLKQVATQRNLEAMVSATTHYY